MDNAAVIRNFIQIALNEGHIERTPEFMWEDVVELVPFPGQGPGVEGVMDVLRAFRIGFPDLVWTVTEQISEGDKVMTRFEIAGTHQGTFLGVPASGHPVQCWGIVIDRLESGRIKDTRLIMDVFGLLSQMAP